MATGQMLMFLLCIFCDKWITANTLGKLQQQTNQCNLKDVLHHLPLDKCMNLSLSVISRRPEKRELNPSSSDAVTAIGNHYNMNTRTKVHITETTPSTRTPTNALISFKISTSTKNYITDLIVSPMSTIPYAKEANESNAEITTTSEAITEALTYFTTAASTTKAATTTDVATTTGALTYFTTAATTTAAATTTDVATKTEALTYSTTAATTTAAATTTDVATTTEAQTRSTTAVTTTTAATTTEVATKTEAQTRSTTAVTTTAAATSYVATTTEATTSASATTISVCSDYLGMENDGIPDENIEASSFENGRDPWNARLNGNWKWSAYTSRPEWIQADIGFQTFVSGVVTQGDGEGDDWVKTLKVSTFYSSAINDLEIFVVNDDGTEMIYDANTDKNSLVTSLFPTPVYAQIVRITCLTRKGDAWQMRFEILGCKP